VTIVSLAPTPLLQAQIFDIWDKAQHAGAFLLLGGWELWAYPTFAARVATGLLVYGGLFELAQAVSAFERPMV
jgi:hypothetical protein